MDLADRAWSDREYAQFIETIAEAEEVAEQIKEIECSG